MNASRAGLAGAALAAATAAVSRIANRTLDERYPPVGRMVPVSGGRLHVLDRPARNGRSDAAIVLLHGASGNLRDLDEPLGPALAAQWRVVAVDRPGHGWSDRPGGAADANPARQAELIAEALGEIGVERAVVLGHSWSGGLAARFALAHRGIAAGLVMLSAATHPWPGGVSWYVHTAAAPVVGPLFINTLVTPMGLATMERVVAEIFHPQTPPARYAEMIAARLLFRPSNFRANAQDMAGLREFLIEQSPHYADIDVPALFITGDADRIVPDLHSRTAARQIEGAELVVLPGIGHMPHHSATEKVVDLIDRHMTRVFG